MKLLKPIGPLLAAPLIHVLFCIASNANPEGGGWNWFLLFILDLPFSILLLVLSQFMSDFAVFGVFGTLWWFAIGVGVRFLYRRIHRSGS